MSDALPIGPKIEWVPPVASPAPNSLHGSHVLLRPVDPDEDAESLYAASHQPDGDPTIWTYLFDGPYEGPERMREALTRARDSRDPLFFAAVPLPGEKALGIVSFLRITLLHGVIEIGHIWFGPTLQRTAAATETIYLLARHAFDDLGFRRLEWKCNALNAASRRAAVRFGFSFEGVFRNHMVIKGRNRDTAWYAITDEEWPPIRAGFQGWLVPENFDVRGRQRRPLGDLIGQARQSLRQ